MQQLLVGSRGVKIVLVEIQTGITQTTDNPLEL